MFGVPPKRDDTVVDEVEDPASQQADGGPPSPDDSSSHPPAAAELDPAMKEELLRLDEEERDSHLRWTQVSGLVEQQLQQVEQLDADHRWLELARQRHVAGLELGDRLAAAEPDVDRKFESFEDAWERLSAYHVYDVQLPRPAEDAQYRHRMDLRALGLQRQAFELSERYYGWLAREAERPDAVDQLGLAMHAAEVEHAAFREQERQNHAVNQQIRHVNEQHRQLLEQQRQVRLQLERLRREEEQRLQLEEQRRQAREQQRLMQQRLEAMQHARDYNHHM